MVLPDRSPDDSSCSLRLGLAVMTERLVTRPLRYGELLGRSLVAALANGIGPHGLARPRPELFGGHYGVTRSLIHGLRALDIGAEASSWAYQPDLSRQPAQAAVVLSGVEVLRQAIRSKERGDCGRLLAGPNLMVLPDHHGGILLSDRIDRVLVPSDWVKIMYEECAPVLKGRIAIWPAGVDTEFWQPYGSGPRRLVLIYNKLERRRAEGVRDFLTRRGYRTAFVSYGLYSPARYRRLLNAAVAMVFVSQSESQGLALAEAWAMDVPTVVLDNRERLVEGRPVRVSTAPYLSEATGCFWSEPEELEARLGASSLARFAPRAWVTANMSDRVCAQDLLALAFPNAPSRAARSHAAGLREHASRHGWVQANGSSAGPFQG